MPRTRRLLLLSLVLLGVLAAALYWQRDALLREGVVRGGRLAGVIVEELEGLRAGRDRLRAERATVVLPASGLRLELSGLELRYRPLRLWRERRIESLRLERLALARLPATESPEPDAPLALERWLALLERPPLTRLEIRELDLPGLPGGRLDLRLLGERDWHLDARLAGIDADLALGAADGAGGLALDLRLSEAGQELASARLSLLREQEGYRLAADGRLQPAPLAARFAAGLPAELRPEAGELDFFFTAGLDALLREQALTLHLRDGSWLRLPAGLLPDVEDLELRLTDEASLPLRLAPQVALEAASLPLSLSGRWQDGSFRIDAELSPTCRLGDALDCRITHDLALQAEAAPAWLQPLHVVGEFGLQGERLAFRQAVDWPQAPESLVLQLTGEHQLGERRGRATLSLPALDFSPERRLSSRLPAWPWPADLVGGTLEAEGGLHWRLPEEGAARWNAEARLQLSELAGVREAWFFTGLSTQLLVAADSASVFPPSVVPTTLDLRELDLGLPIEDIHLAFALDGAEGVLRLDALRAALLGGRVFTQDQRLDAESAENSLDLHFEGIRVESLLELADYQGVEASGAFEGSIPLRVAEGQVRVEAGELRAPGGGVIRYRPTPGTSSGNAGVDLVQQALSNYHYESLESSVDYAPEGELLLSMRLQGYNPDMNGGQRINLNLNLSDNIPQLLRSLQAGRRVEEMLRERLE